MRRRRDASGLRLSFRTRAVRASRHRRRADLRRSVARSDGGDGQRRSKRSAACAPPAYRWSPATTATIRRRRRCAREAARIGLPLVIKASAGGGGRGMRVVDDLATFDEALEAAQREARGGVRRRRRAARTLSARSAAHRVPNSRRRARHDHSPRRARVLDSAAPPKDRRGSAVGRARRRNCGRGWAPRRSRAARSVGYTNAGTVEFLLDGDGTFDFLEMNARLQVEHPVTELVYGIDLVHGSCASRAANALRCTQAGVDARGWAIEVRLNAEDPAHDYAPQTGTIAAFDVRAGPACGSTPAYAPAARCRSSTIRCWPRSSCGPRIARPPSRGSRRRSRTRASAAWRRTCRYCARSRPTRRSRPATLRRASLKSAAHRLPPTPRSTRPPRSLRLRRRSCARVTAGGPAASGFRCCSNATASAYASFADRTAARLAPIRRRGGRRSVRGPDAGPRSKLDRGCTAAERDRATDGRRARQRQRQRADARQDRQRRGSSGG